MPEKDRETIGQRITFLASDGSGLLKNYLEWREQRGGNITPESPLFASRTGKGITAITEQKVNEMLHSVAKKAGFNGTWPYGYYALIRLGS